MGEKGREACLFDEIDRLAGAPGRRPVEPGGDLPAAELAAAAQLARLDWSAESRQRERLRRMWAAHSAAPQPAHAALRAAGVWAARLALTAVAVVFVFAAVKLMEQASTQGWVTIGAHATSTVSLPTAELTAVALHPMVVTAIPLLPAQTAVPRRPALVSSPASAEVRLGKGQVRAMAVSADGRSLAVGSTATVCLYDASSFASRWCAGSPGQVYRLAFDPSGRSVLAGTADGWVALWNGTTGDTAFQIKPTTAPVEGIAWSPDGSRFGVADGAGNLIIRSQTTGADLQTLTSPDRAFTTLAWSPDGQRLAAGSGGQAEIWDLAGGKTLQVLNPERPADLPYTATGLAWTPDGRSIVMSSGYYSAASANGPEIDVGRVVVWDASSGAQSQSFSTGDLPMGFALSPDAAQLAGQHPDGSVQVWDVASGRVAAALPRVGIDQTQMAWSGDGSRLFVESSGGQVAAWNARDQQLTEVLGDYTGPVNEVAWSPDGKILAVSYVQGQLTLWDPQTWTVTDRWPGSPVQSLTLAWKPSNEKRLLAVGGDTVVIWNMENATPVRQLEGDLRMARALAWSPKGWEIAAGGDNGSVLIWESNTGQELRSIDAGHPVDGLAWSPDEQQLIVSWADSSGQGLDVFNTQTGARLETPWTGSDIAHLSVSPDGARAASLAGGVAVWDLASRQLLFNLDGGQSLRQTAFAWSPDGAQIASAAQDVFLWDLSTLQQTQIFTGHTAPVTTLSYRPDGTTLASGGEDGTVLIWKVR
jgi:WD40 repeat protein